MPTGQLAVALRRLRQLFGLSSAGPTPDVHLLERFAATRDEDAFAALVERHGPMVLGVCRRVLRNEADAEDAFQAVFLVLARKAASVRRRESVGGWLHRVAYRLAVHVRTADLRRREREREAGEMPRDHADNEADRTELRQVLDEELQRLPEKYRTPLVLCYLEDRTNAEVAAELGCPVGSISWRLARGREMLRRYLARRGLAVTAGLITAALAEAQAAGLPPALRDTTVRAAVHFTLGHGAVGAAGPARTLAEGMLKTMFATKLKITAVVLAVALTGAATPLVLHQMHGAPPAVKEEPRKTESGKPEATDTVTWNALRTIDTTKLSADGKILVHLVFAPDGKTFASTDGTTVRLWDVNTGKQRTSLELQPGGLPRDIINFQLPRMVFAPDGKRVATADSAGVQVWDVARKETLATFEWKLGLTDNNLGGIFDPSAVGLSAVAFSPGGKMVAVGLSDGSVKLWDLTPLWEKKEAPKEELAAFKGTKKSPQALAFSRDGKRLVAALDDGGARVWSVTTRKELAAVKGGEQDSAGLFPAARTVAFAPDAQGVASIDSGEVVLWELASQKKLASLTIGEKGASYGNAFEVGPDGKVKVTEIKVTVVTSVALSPDGKTLAAGHNDGTIAIWGLGEMWEKGRAPKKPLVVLKGHPRKKGDDALYTQVWALAFSPDGKRLVSASDDGTIKLWEASAPGKEKSQGGGK
ncbi:MAG TPA: sigma-70 family RNA polymerase sigma factor [Gemmataceae bacterium]|nr:sigma-70 family RNA polymerase sigma factor [Gemmataceae bacterium]